MKVLWFLTVLSSMLAGGAIFFTLTMGRSAPQEAAGYAMACAFAIVPYVFARAVQAIVEINRGESTQRIVDAIEKSHTKA